MYYGISASNPIFVAGGVNSIGNVSPVISNTFPESLTHTLFGVTAGAGGANGVSGTSQSSFDYTWTFTVAAIPEPASLATLALGGLALLARRRR